MDDKLYNLMNWPLIEGIEYTDIDNPCDLLGQHLTNEGLLIQAFLPNADSVKVRFDDKTVDMQKMDENGFFAALVNSKKEIQYKLIATYEENIKEFYDPYSFDHELAIKDLRKFNAGILYDAYKIMGAHKCTINNVEGVRFVVWAPYAVRVSVVGDFNDWDGRMHQMSRIEDTGIFAIFIPDLKENTFYKYEIKIKGGKNVLKSDPYAFKMEEKEDAATIITDTVDFKWTDQEWLKNREKTDTQETPISIYHMNIGTFIKDADNKANYRDVADELVKYIKNMGYTHVELMPVMESSYDNPLSGYFDTTSFYSLKSQYGSIEDFMYFVNVLHANKIGVILDWCPEEFSSDENGMKEFDGSYLYEHMDPKKGINPKTGSCIFNYARPEVTNYLISNAFMWIRQFHIDGLKVFNVATMLYLDYDRNPGEWEPNIYGGNENLDAIEFIKHFNSIIHKSEKGVITIAEDNSGYPEMTGEVTEECLGFDYKWNYDWRKDFLEYMSNMPDLRESHYNELSLSMIYQYRDNFMIGFPDVEFTNGEASLIGRMTGDTEERKFANMRLALAYTFVHPGKKILFMGQDMAQYSEWLPAGKIDFDLLKLDKHKNLNDFVKCLNEIYVSQPSLFECDNDESGFEWINNISARESILTFVRKAKNDDDMLVVVCNFDAVNRDDYKIGVPKAGKYKEIFNSDNEKFGGNNYTNDRLKQSKKDECDGREDSIRINVPSLSVVILKYTKEDLKLKDNKAAKENMTKKETTKKETTNKVTAKKVTSKKTATAKKATTDINATADKTNTKKTSSTKQTAKKAVVKKTVEEKTTGTKVAEKKVNDSNVAELKVAEVKVNDSKNLAETTNKATEKSEENTKVKATTKAKSTTKAKTATKAKSATKAKATTKAKVSSKTDVDPVKVVDKEMTKENAKKATVSKSDQKKVTLKNE